MRILLWEWKKLFRPIPILLCLGVFLLLTQDAPKNYLRGKQLLDTEHYPESFTIYDDYSISILFHDFLMETYGNPIYLDHLEDLTRRRNTLLEQIETAVQYDETLIQTKTVFDREWMHFISTTPPSSTGQPQEELSEEDQIYVLSCVNGQMKLAGTEHPIGFLYGLNNVISVLQREGVYHVLSSDLLYPVMSQNIKILKYLIFAVWILIVPYGISEARSRTETLRFSTKQGRKHYRKQAFAASTVCFFLIAAGMWAVYALFGSMEIESYWETWLDTLSAKDEFGRAGIGLILSCRIQYGQLYWLLLGMTGVVGFVCAVMIVHISLQCRHPVSAIACGLPLILAFDAWTTENANGLGSDHFQVPLIRQCILAGLFVLVMCIFSTAVSVWKYKKDC